ncbi:DNA-3-methyladenine glycosylase I [Kangiella koreensis]|uniref:DNA-3-methyladenine glycosylase I n=1 Tax=Kangiella koreensis (strain DSM 16069 / JCM 12317 / KCTC 12182 / SW-125) TaxID=523791 RepID=C7R9S6_KANKD|nr:DNA-3-methyladenine glycosylase I [Kangiella koreensis]ACV27945.1 DNA-3-methyladenine glycosylase I [Kangiella koreensis DSM 16069]
MKTRCGWVSDDPLYIEYHDTEWGVPTYDDQELFEMLCLEGAQAGLSWITVLKKRKHYRKVFDNFDAEKIAAYDEGKREELLSDAGIIRNKLKVNAFIVNAQNYLRIKEERTFSEYLWQFVGGEPIVNNWQSLKQVPVTTPESDAMAKQLKKDGFKFVGSTICYAFMQATGMVDDHTKDCFKK